MKKLALLLILITFISCEKTEDIEIKPYRATISISSIHKVVGSHISSYTRVNGLEWSYYINSEGEKDYCESAGIYKHLEIFNGDSLTIYGKTDIDTCYVSIVIDTENQHIRRDFLHEGTLKLIFLNNKIDINQ